MGDIGDYWREHKEHARDKKAADAIGLSVSQYRKRLRVMEQEERRAAKAQRLASHTIQCECGRTFLNVSAHNSHKTRWGKSGHKGTPIQRGKP